MVGKLYCIIIIINKIFQAIQKIINTWKEYLLIVKTVILCKKTLLYSIAFMFKLSEEYQF